MSRSVGSSEWSNNLKPEGTNTNTTYTPWAYQNPGYITVGKVALDFEEIEKLRSVANADPKIKAILQKLAHLIDIKVSF